MRKPVIIALVACICLSLAACDSNPGGTAHPTLPDAYTTPAVSVLNSSELNEYFNNDVTGNLNKLSGYLRAFACAVHAFPSSLTEPPDADFGWTFMYQMIVYNGVTTTGITTRDDHITATEDAITNLQRNTIGGLAWLLPGDLYAPYVAYDEKSGFTIDTSKPREYASYLEDVSYNADSDCIEVTVAVYATDGAGTLADAIGGRYILRLRALSSSAYGYVISTFGEAE